MAEGATILRVDAKPRGLRFLGIESVNINLWHDFGS